jgi:protein-disulfide isomerase
VGRDRRQQRLNERRSQGAKPAVTPGAGGQGGNRRPSKPAWRETIDSWGGLTVVGAVVGAVLIAAFLIFLNRPGATVNSDPFEAREHGGAPQSGFVLGDPNAPVRLIEYSDFQCPFCHRFWDEVEPTLVDEYVATGKATIEYRNYVFIGAESQRAAEAAACAADQNLFWDFHDMLFHRQGQENAGVYSDSNLKTYARQVQETVPEFDVDAWESCFNAGTHTEAIREQSRVASNQGIASTPTLLVNGRAIVGAQALDTYRQAIDAALAGN